MRPANTMKLGVSAMALMMSAAVFGGNATSARADHDQFAVGGSLNSFGVGAFFGTGGFGSRPVERICESRPREVWREPVYDVREVWVDVPARVETRRVPRYASCGTLLGYDLVETVVEPARRELRTEQVVVRPGFFDTVYEQVCFDRERPCGTTTVARPVPVHGAYRPTIARARPHHWGSPVREARFSRDHRWDVNVNDRR